MELRTGYKQTEVGVIPEAWEAEPLIGKVSIEHGYAFASKHFAAHGPFRLTTPGHFYETGGFRDIGRKQKFYIGPVSGDYVLSCGDMIVAMTEQADGLLGSAALIPQVEGYLHNQRLGRVKALSSEIELAYLYYVFNSAGFRAKVRETAAGTKVKHTSPKKLLEIFVSLPPVDEQRTIASTLGSIDALLVGLDQLISKKRDLKKAVMQQLLTGRTRLPGFHGEWEVKCLGDVARIKTGSRNNDDKIADGQYPFFVRSDVVERIDSYSHDCEAVLVPGEGRIGSIFHYINGRFDLHQRVYAITQFASGVSGKFVHLFMSQHFGAWAMQNTVKATVDSLRLPTFKTFALFLPPTLAEQTAIAVVLSDMDAELAAQEQRRDKIRALKQAMMQELLTGKTRLIAGGVANA